MLWPVILLFVPLFLYVINWNCVIVDLPDGKIKGRVIENEIGKKYFAFQQIPYAAPPIGPNRFQVPKQVEPWEGVLEATENTKVCVQLNSEAPFQTEDCLYLNIFTPIKPGSHDLLPVLFWIHGGDFTSSASLYETQNPINFVNNNIVVVTFNYRLGPFGFLSTMDGVIPANLGLKDQRMALKWVNSHISLFGGDPQKITIGGHSSGATSVGFLTLDPKNEGLFRGVVQLSGSPLIRNSITKNANSYAYELVSQLDKSITITKNNSKQLLDVLRNASVADIKAAAANINPLFDYSSAVSVVWAPVIEDVREIDPVIIKPMLEQFLEGSFLKVPALMGYTSVEALSLNTQIIEQSSELQTILDAAPLMMIPTIFNVSMNNLVQMSSELKQIYTNSSFTNNKAAFIQYLSDASITNGLIKQAQIFASYENTFLYQFSYMGTEGLKCYPERTRPNVTGAEGAGHSEDLTYLWGVSNENESVKDKEVSQQLIKLLTNFIYYQNPTPGLDSELDITWPPVTSNFITYLNIDDCLTSESNPRSFDKIDRIFKKYLMPPYIVY